MLDTICWTALRWSCAYILFDEVFTNTVYGFNSADCLPVVYEAPFNCITKVLLLTIGGATNVEFKYVHLSF